MMRHQPSTWQSIIAVVVIAQLVLGLIAFGPVTAAPADQLPPAKPAENRALPAAQVLPQATYPAAATASAPEPEADASVTVANAQYSSTPDQVQFEFAVHQPFISPGEALTFTLSVINPTAVPLTGLMLTASLPANAPLVRSDEGLALTADGQQIAWPVPTMEPGQRLTASFTCQVADVSVGTLIASQVTVSGIESPVPLFRIASAEVASLATDTAIVTPGQAVWLRSIDQRVALRLPATAFSSAAQVQYAAAVETPTAPPGEMLFSFALTAIETASGQPTALDTNARLFAQARAASSLFRYDDALQSWQRIDLDYASGYYVASIDALGIYVVTLDSSYGREIFPTVTGFKSDEWSGNSSVHIPLELPPGPGGLNLPLSLDYSSESVNGLRATGDGSIDADQASHFYYQAGIAGWGWDIGGLGAVTWDHSSSPGRVMLSFAGGSFELVKTPNNGWQTSPQSFYRIEHGEGYQYSDPWYVYTPDGTRYKFGTGGGGNGDTWLVAPNCSTGEARNQYLTEVRDVHGNRIEIKYATETAKFNCTHPADPPKHPEPYPSEEWYPRAIRPDRINYYDRNTGSGGASTTRIIFNYGSRSDTGIEGKGDYKQTYWSNYRLGYIDIRVRTKCNVDSTDPAHQDDCFDTVRSYWLDSTYSWWNQGADKGLMLLANLTEKNAGGVGLPAWTFQYQNYGLGSDWLNHTMLRWADNGQAGSIIYDYAPTNNIWIDNCGANTSRYRMSVSDVSDGRGVITRTVYESNNTLGRAWALGPFPACQNHFIFQGFQHVTTRSIQVLNGAETLQRIVDTDYRQRDGSSPDPGRGKIELQITRNPDGAEIMQVDPGWSIVDDRGVKWVRQDSETRTVGAKAQTTTYQYDAEHQGNSNYGLPTLIREYRDGGSTLYRQREQWYTVNTNAWIVDRLARGVLRDASGVCKGETRYFYVDPNGTTAPVDLQYTQTAQTSCDGTWSETHFTTDAWGNRTSVTDPRGNTTTTTYDTTGSYPKYLYPLTVTEQPIGATQFTTTYTWDKLLAQTLTATDANSVTTSYKYDGWGRLTSVIKPEDSEASPTIRYTYNCTVQEPANCQPFKVTVEKKNPDDLGDGYHKTWQFYSGTGTLIQTQSETATAGTASVVSSQYNALDLLAQQTVPYGHTAPGTYQVIDWVGAQARTRYAYDGAGRPTLTTYPDNTTQRAYYLDWQTAVIDPVNHQTIQEADAFGRLKAARQYVGTYAGEPNWTATPYGVADYEYDEANRLTKVWQPDDHDGQQRLPIKLTYDLAGRKINLDDPDMGAWSYGYDAAGNLTRQTDARNQTVCLYYDQHNRVKGKTYTTGTACPTPDPGYGNYAIKYYYDKNESGGAVVNGIGRRTYMMDASGSTRWQYDARGRATQVLKRINGTSYTTSYTYDPLDLVSTITYPDGEVVTQKENAALLPFSLQGTNAYIQSSSYDVAGRLTGQVYSGSQFSGSRSYHDWTAPNGQGRLRQITTGGLVNLTYYYDAAGNPLTLLDSNNDNQKQCFRYDDLGRLGRGTSNDDYGLGCSPNTGQGNYTQVYYYTPSGNIDAIESSDGVSDYDYNTQVSGCGASQARKPHAVSSTTRHGATTGSYAYDCNGNVITRTEAATPYAQTWDAENRLARVTGNGQDVNYIYDGDGQLVQRTDQTGAMTLYVGPHFEVSIAGSATPTPTPSATPSPTGSATPTPSVTPSLTPSATPTHTPTATPTATVTPGGEGGSLELTSVADSYLARWSATTNYGNSTTLNTRYAGATEEFSTLLRFDLTGIPAGATIQSAQLTLTVTNSPASWLDLDVFQAYRAWTESAVTWNQAQSGVNWTTAGCNGAGTDRAANPAASARIQQTAGGAVTISLPASLIAGWLADPSSNQGVLLRPKLNTGGAILTYTFASSEHGTASYRPKLTVSYTTPTGRLDPDSAALLAALPMPLAQPASWTAAAPDAPTVASVPTGQTWRSYYFLGGQRIALRERSPQNQTGIVHYLLTDQLGSTSVVADATGAQEARQWYYPFGSPRANVNNLPTDRRFTGQRSEEATLGALYDFVARPYSPTVGRFLAPDSIVPEPGNPQALNRYSYALNAPLRYTDPTGHYPYTPLPFPDFWLPQAGQVLSEWWMRLQPHLYQLAVDLSNFSASPLAGLTIQQAQQVDAAGNQATSNAGSGGNTAAPNPNDPWGRFRNLAQNSGLNDLEGRLRGNESDVVGAQRQLKLMERLGDGVREVEVAFRNNLGRGSADVMDTAGNLYEVGGPGKVISPDAMSMFGRQLQILAREATIRGVKAYFAYDGPDDWLFTINTLCNRWGVELINMGAQ